jgi:hypothetical protein
VQKVRNFFLGLDLGQAQDFTALAVAERKEYKFTEPRAQCHIRHLQRFKLGTAYPDIVQQVKRMYEQPPLCGQSALVVDATGVGRPVVDLFRKAGLRPVAITITGGQAVSVGYGGYRVPKRDLVVNLAVMLQTGRLKIAGQLPEAQTLINELLNFKVKIDPRTAHDSYEAWREGVHDDLVLAVAMAVWYAERYKRSRPIPKPSGW